MVKVGDKIRILFDGADHANVKRGDEFVVCKVFGDEDVQVDGEYKWRFNNGSYEVIHATPPEKITKNGYEYSLVGPVKPEWLVDGAWVVRKDNGCKHQVVLNKDGLLVLTMPGTCTTILPNRHTYDQYRPHEPKDWKWGDWAMYEGKRVFVMCGLEDESSMIAVTFPNIDSDGYGGWDKNHDFIESYKLTPTF